MFFALKILSDFKSSLQARLKWYRFFLTCSNCKTSGRMAPSKRHCGRSKRLSRLDPATQQAWTCHVRLLRCTASFDSLAMFSTVWPFLTLLNKTARNAELHIMECTQYSWYILCFPIVSCDNCFVISPGGIIGSGQGLSPHRCWDLKSQ